MALKILKRLFPVGFLTVSLAYLTHGAIPSNLMKHPAWVYLDRFECGENAADRIIGGINAALGQFPSIVRLGYSDYGEAPEWRCGGVLVSDRHVVTAAHCALENLKMVRLGEYNILQNPDCQGGVCAPPVQDLAVKRVVPHPDFNKPKFHNDIAVLELVKPVQLHDYVSPICLPRAGQLGALSVGDMVSVAGWGTTNLTYFDEISILRTVQLPVIDTLECNKLKVGTFVAGDGEICAGGVRNRDTCEGDSGGPLMKIFDNDDDGPKTYLVGVVSFGPISCGRRIPGVYASVAHYMRWILDKLVGL